MIVYDFKFDEEELVAQEHAARTRLAEKHQPLDEVDPNDDEEFAAYRRAYIASRSAQKAEIETAARVTSEKLAKIGHDHFVAAMKRL